MNYLDQEYRRTGIGGSDVGAILGVNPFRSPLDVYMDKLGLKEPEPDNEKMRWGRILEPTIAQEFCKQRKTPLGQGQHRTVVIDDVKIFGTPDFIIGDRGVTHQSCVLEVKTAGLHMAGFWGEPGTDNAPLTYIAQVALYLMLEDMEQGYIAALIGGQDYREYEIHHDRELEAAIKDAIVTFWKVNIVGQNPPEARSAEEYQKFLKARYPRSTGEMLVADSRVTLRMRELAQVREALKRLDEREQECVIFLQKVIADSDGVQSDEFQATWKSAKATDIIDYKQLVTDLNLPPEQIDRYKSMKPGVRRFLFKELEIKRGSNHD